MRIISGVAAAPTSELAAFIELAKDPEGFEAKLKQLEAAKTASEVAASLAASAEEKARREQAAAAAAIDEATAIMAGARKGQNDLAAEKEAFAAARRDFAQIEKGIRDELGGRTAALEEREKAAERREVALRAREGNLEKGEAAVSALRTEYEAKLGALKKLVA